jgi:hypothetical protein
MGNSQPGLIAHTITDDANVSDGTVIPITLSVCHICRSSFKVVIKEKIRPIGRMKASKMGAGDGVHEFFTDFYDRLMLLPNTADFDSILRPGNSDKYQVSRRGAILMRIVRFVLNIQSENEQVSSLFNVFDDSYGSC